MKKKQLIVSKEWCFSIGCGARLYNTNIRTQVEFRHMLTVYLVLLIYHWRIARFLFNIRNKMIPGVFRAAFIWFLVKFWAWHVCVCAHLKSQMIRMMAQLRWQCHLLRCNRKLGSSVTSISAAKYTRINFDIIGENISRFGCFQQSLYCLSMYLYVNACVWVRACFQLSSC